MTASAAGPGRFLFRLFFGLFGFFGFFRSLLFGQFLFHGRFFFSANCAVLGTASAASCNALFVLSGTTCAGFRTSPAPCMGTGQCNTAHADQTGDA
jgi:hypothetical protein